MEVNVQVERTSEALDERHGPALCRPDPVTIPSPAAQRAENGTQEKPQDLRGQRCIVGQAVAQADGQREDPLPHRDEGEHAIDKVRRGVRHATPSAGTAEPAALAGEGHKTVLAAGVAVDAKESVGQDAAIQERAEFPFDKARQWALAAALSLDERLELRPDGAVQDAPLGATRQVVASGLAGGGERELRGGSGGHDSRVMPEACRRDASELQ